jgi:hypothetical protein
MAIAHSFGNVLKLNFHGSAETFALVCHHDNWISRLVKCWLLSSEFVLVLYKTQFSPRLSGRFQGVRYRSDPSHAFHARQCREL